MKNKSYLRSLPDYFLIILIWLVAIINSSYIPASFNALIKFYDNLVKYLIALVNEEHQSGVLKLNLIGTFSRASGVYYYQIKAGNFVETKKMIYLK